MGAVATARETSSRLPPARRQPAGEQRRAPRFEIRVAREAYVERLELPRGLEQQQRGVAAAVLGERDLGLEPDPRGLARARRAARPPRPPAAHEPHRTPPPPGWPGRLRALCRLAGRDRRSARPHAAGTRPRPRSRRAPAPGPPNARARGRPPRPGPAAAAARCHARRSGSTSRFVTSANARWAARRSGPPADR